MHRIHSPREFLRQQSEMKGNKCIGLYTPGSCSFPGFRSINGWIGTEDKF